FEDQIAGLFDNIFMVGVSLIVTGTMLFITQWAQNEKRPLTGWRAMVMGIAQAVAIIPGISRSGSTVSAGMFLGMPREKVAKFSFLMALPIIFGATIMEARAAFAAETFAWSGIIIGTATAFLFGYFAVKWLLRAIIKGKLYLFGLYCLAVGFLAIIFG
ncbi:MAG: undecaprenyl-diphosphate phosphatase, partial [Candidatus Marinimicrobia bacterium]|nr:undecaprenyl-diphosphate phosphatase [Candidatus Neomarinimicrobiota bacterium]